MNFIFKFTLIFLLFCYLEADKHRHHHRHHHHKKNRPRPKPKPKPQPVPLPPPPPPPPPTSIPYCIPLPTTTTTTLESNNETTTNNITTTTTTTTTYSSTRTRRTKSTTSGTTTTMSDVITTETLDFNYFEAKAFSTRQDFFLYKDSTDKDSVSSEQNLAFIVYRRKNTVITNLEFVSVSKEPNFALISVATLYKGNLVDTKTVFTDSGEEFKDFRPQNIDTLLIFINNLRLIKIDNFKISLRASFKQSQSEQSDKVSITKGYLTHLEKEGVKNLAYILTKLNQTECDLNKCEEKHLLELDDSLVELNSLPKVSVLNEIYNYESDGVTFNKKEAVIDFDLTESINLNSIIVSQSSPDTFITATVYSKYLPIWKQRVQDSGDVVNFDFYPKDDVDKISIKIETESTKIENVVIDLEVCSLTRILENNFCVKQPPVSLRMVYQAVFNRLVEFEASNNW